MSSDGIERRLVDSVFADDKSLVDVDREQRTFCVWLIPETLEITTFGDRVAGDFINLEVDPQTVAIVATVERVLAAKEKKA